MPTGNPNREPTPRTSARWPLNVATHAHRTDSRFRLTRMEKRNDWHRQFSEERQLFQSALERFIALYARLIDESE